MNAGLWGATLLATTGPVALRDPYVRTTLPLPRTDAADLTVYVDATNATDQAVTTTVDATIEEGGHAPISLSQTVTLDPNERREIAFHPAAYPQLHVDHPDLWWPYRLGKPDLYRLVTSASVDGRSSDLQATRFGIRQFTDARQTVRGTSFVRYFVNGRPIFIRGGGYMWDLQQRLNPRDAAATVAYTKAMGLNTIRLEGTLGNRTLYEAADRAGVMIMPGFVCCSIWQNDQRWTPEQADVAAASLDTQMRALRAHPSAFMWAFGSDCPVDSRAPTPLQAHRPGAPLAEPHPRRRGDVVRLERRDEDGRPVRVGATGAVVDDRPSRERVRHDGRGGHADRRRQPRRSARFFRRRSGGRSATHGTSTPGGRAARSTRSTGPPMRSIIDTGVPPGSPTTRAKRSCRTTRRPEAFFEAWNAHAFDGCAGRCASFGDIYWMLNAGWPSVNWSLFPSTFQPGGAFFGAQIGERAGAHRVRLRDAAVSTWSTTRCHGRVRASPPRRPCYDVARSGRAVHLRVSERRGARQRGIETVFRVPPVSGGSRTYFLRLQLRDAAGGICQRQPLLVLDAA